MKNFIPKDRWMKENRLETHDLLIGKDDEDRI